MLHALTAATIYKISQNLAAALRCLGLEARLVPEIAMRREISNNDIFEIAFSELRSTSIAESSSEKSKADGITQRAGNRSAETLDVGAVFCLNHDASERLGPRVTKDDTTRFAERGFCFGKSAGHLRK